MNADAAPGITICEVGPRDGLQNEKKLLSVEARVQLIDRLSACGLARIEAVSFVHPQRVPQMAQAEEVLAQITRQPGTRYAGLVLNERGAERALNAGVDELHFAQAVTETFNRRNQSASVAESVAQFERIAALARRAGIYCTATIGASFGCPFEGLVAPDTVWALAERLSQAGAQEIVLADTIGAGVPSQVTTLINGLRERLGVDMPIGCHFHNTRNTGLANAYAAIAAGVRLLDASVGGAGGCPFAPKATGNIPTEDLAYLLRGMQLATGIDLAGLIETARWLEGALEHPLPGLLMKAGLFPEVVESDSV